MRTRTTKQEKKSKQRSRAFPLQNQSRGPWSKQEDNILKQVIRRHGPRQWVNISRLAEDIGMFRDAKQCRERFVNHLSPRVIKRPWTTEEDLEILRLQRKYGNRWSKISRELVGRSDNDIKNRWNTRLGKGNCELVAVLDE
ncbi:hypothetical protein BT69DRAFT_1348091, partial [Atractiella rhizophila]